MKGKNQKILKPKYRFIMTKKVQAQENLMQAQKCICIMTLI